MPSSDATLSSLVVAGATITPAFNPSIQGYSTRVNLGTTDVFVTLTKNDAGATIKYKGITITSGASVDYSLNSSVNILDWIVTAADGVTQIVYTLVVNVAAAPPGPTCSGVVTNNLAGNLLTFTDTGSYGTVSARTLVIKNSVGTVLTTINMGSSLTATYAISADAYFEFDLSVTDGSGTYTCVVDYVAYGFYTIAYLNQFSASNCGCDLNSDNLDIAEKFLQAAFRFNIANNPAASQANILAANYYVNLSPVTQLP